MLVDSCGWGTRSARGSGDAAVALLTCQLEHDSLADGLGLVTGVDLTRRIRFWRRWFSPPRVFSIATSFPTRHTSHSLTPRRDGERAGEAVEGGGDRRRRCRRRDAEDDAGGPAEGGPRERRGLGSHRHRRLGVGGDTRGRSRPFRTRARTRGRQEDVLAPGEALDARQGEEEARRGSVRWSSRRAGRHADGRGGPWRRLRRPRIRRRPRRGVGRHRDLARAGDVHDAHRDRLPGRAEQMRGGAS